MDYLKILTEAHAAACAAVAGQPDNGACGFAWVTIDGNDGLARFCHKDRGVNRAFGSKGYPTGWQFWCPGNFRGQSVEAHERGAKAFRDKLAEYGIRATSNSRLD